MDEDVRKAYERGVLLLIALLMVGIVVTVLLVARGSRDAAALLPGDHVAPIVPIAPVVPLMRPAPPSSVSTTPAPTTPATVGAQRPARSSRG